MAAQERRRPAVALRLGRRLVPGAILLAVVLSAPLVFAGEWVAALIFGIAPLAWLGAVTRYVARVERRSRDALLSAQEADLEHAEGRVARDGPVAD